MEKVFSVRDKNGYIVLDQPSDRWVILDRDTQFGIEKIYYDYAAPYRFRATGTVCHTYTNTYKDSTLYVTLRDIIPAPCGACAEDFIRAAWLDWEITWLDWGITWLDWGIK